MKSFTEFAEHKAIKGDTDVTNNLNEIIGKTIKSMEISDGGDAWILNFEGGDCAIVDAGIDSSNAKDGPIARISIVHALPVIKEY